ncbi:MAG: hydrogenase expression/formation C-terminal domain-containing protein [Negativicutes bacterium]|nr:hydrogenase expression/formation C-terminal domain-containing protein [Negativicutes bacterium]
MPESEATFSAKARAVLAEIAAAVERLRMSGERWVIFINRMALSQEERQMIRDFLGEGSVRIQLENTAEPTEWLESGVSGVWYGVFYDQSKNPLLETIEVALFPQVAAVQPEDLGLGLIDLKRRLAETEESGG